MNQNAGFKHFDIKKTLIFEKNVPFCMACAVRNHDFSAKQGPDITPHGCILFNINNLDEKSKG